MRPYKVVDVFTSKPFLGNPVGVVLDADGLDAGDMHAITRWTNLSAVTFLSSPTRPEADYRLRIFTPGAEIPFAGHPTLGSAHAALEAGRVAARDGVLMQECGVGLVRVAAMGGRQTLTLPPAKVTSLSAEDIAELEAILGQSVQHDATPAKVDVGPVWIIARLDSAEHVLALQPDLARSLIFERRLGASGITVFGPHQAGDAAIEVRTFAPSIGIKEDPVCGSGNGSVAAFQWHRKLLAGDAGTYVAAQGQKVGRDGRLFVSIDAEGEIKIGGHCVTCIDGVIHP